MTGIVSFFFSSYCAEKGGPKIVNTDKKRQDLEQARAQENIKKIQTMLQTGIPFLKHNRKGKIKKRLLKSLS